MLYSVQEGKALARLTGPSELSLLIYTISTQIHIKHLAYSYNLYFVYTRMQTYKRTLFKLMFLLTKAPMILNDFNLIMSFSKDQSLVFRVNLHSFYNL